MPSRSIPASPSRRRVADQADRGRRRRDARPPAGGSGFGGDARQRARLARQSQTEAATGAQALATGTAQDPTAVVMAVERAQLSMQLASQIRTKLVEAAQDIFHTQV